MENFDKKKGMTKMAMGAAGTPGMAVAGRLAMVAVEKSGQQQLQHPAWQWQGLVNWRK